MYESFASNRQQQIMSAPPPSAAAGSSAEAQAAAFAQDERCVVSLKRLLHGNHIVKSLLIYIRVYFNKATDTWRFEQADGSELEYDATKGSWVPLVSQDVCTTIKFF